LLTNITQEGKERDRKHGRRFRFKVKSTAYFVLGLANNLFLHSFLGFVHVFPSRSAAAGAKPTRELKVEDALLYLDQVSIFQILILDDEIWQDPYGSGCLDDHGR
jgi:hypothetical protein